MKPYEPNWPHGYCTRDGRPVRIICTDGAGYELPIVGLVLWDNGAEVVHRWHSDGLALAEDVTSESDLMCADQKPKEYWLCVGTGAVTWHGNLDEARSVTTEFPEQNLTIYHAVEVLDDAAEKPS